MLLAITDSEIIEIMNEFDVDHYEIAMSIIRLRSSGHSSTEKENMIITWFKNNTSCIGVFPKGELEEFLTSLIRI
jgi:hypothetical protein